MIGVLRSGKMSIGIRTTASTAPSTTATMPTIIVMGCRMAKIIGFITAPRRSRSCLRIGNGHGYYSQPLGPQERWQGLKMLNDRSLTFPATQAMAGEMAKKAASRQADPDHSMT